MKLNKILLRYGVTVVMVATIIIVYYALRNVNIENKVPMDVYHPYPTLVMAYVPLHTALPDSKVIKLKDDRTTWTFRIDSLRGEQTSTVLHLTPADRQTITLLKKHDSHFTLYLHNGSTPLIRLVFAKWMNH